MQPSGLPKFAIEVAVPPEEGRLHRMELVRDGETIHCYGGEGQRSRYRVVDEEPPERAVSFYYVRVTLHDHNMAWSSPIWVRHG